MASNKTVEAYNRIAKYYDELHFTPEFWRKEFGLFRKLVPGQTVIDIGCGTGRDGILFVKSKFDYTGIDAADNILRIARQRVPAGKFILMNFYQLQFSAETFDGFWAAASLLHVPKQKIDRVLKSIWKILKSGGIGFVAIKEKKGVGETVIREEKYGGLPRYLSFYTQSEFAKKLRKSGFRILKVAKRKQRSQQSTPWLCYFVRKVP